MQLLPRYTHNRLEDERKIARLILETGGGTPDPPRTVARATLAGDPRRLRGIPAIGYSVTGATPGSTPHLDAQPLRSIR